MRSMKRRYVMTAFAILIAAAAGGTALAEDEKSSPRRIDISVTDAGFEPKKVSVKKGEEVTLAFTRKTDKTCATEVILYVNDKERVAKKLPLNQVVPVTVTFSNSGQVGYACAMNMIGGVIVVQ